MFYVALFLCILQTIVTYLHIWKQTNSHSCILAWLFVPLCPLSELCACMWRFELRSTIKHQHRCLQFSLLWWFKQCNVISILCSKQINRDAYLCKILFIFAGEMYRVKLMYNHQSGSDYINASFINVSTLLLNNISKTAWGCKQSPCCETTIIRKWYKINIYI